MGLLTLGAAILVIISWVIVYKIFKRIFKRKR